MTNIAEEKPTSGNRDDLFSGLPLSCDWVESPSAWSTPLDRQSIFGERRKTKLAPGQTLCRDGTAGVVRAKQVSRDAGGYAVEVQIEDYDAEYVSLALDLPASGLVGLGRDHILRLDLRLASEATEDAYVRFNLFQGTHSLSQTRMMRDTTIEEFDLFEFLWNRTPINKIWFDLILSHPKDGTTKFEMVQFSRYLRLGF